MELKIDTGGTLCVSMASRETRLDNYFVMKNTGNIIYCIVFLVSLCFLRSLTKGPVHTREPINPRSLPLLKNGRIGNEQALIGESVCWSKIQHGLVGPALRGRGERDQFFNWLKMVGDDLALHRSYVERGYSMVIGGTA